MKEGGKPTLEGLLGRVRLRTAANVLLTQAAVVLSLAGSAAAVALAVERIFAMAVIGPASLIAAGVAVLLAIAALAVLRTPNRMQVAVLIDHRLGAKERFSTALALAESDDEFARAAEAEAHQAARRMRIEGKFPVRPTLHWIGPVVAWSVAAAVFFFLPTLDVLGSRAAQVQAADQAAQLEQTRAEVKRAVSKVQTVIEQAKAPQLSTDLDQLAELLAKGERPDNLRREALKPLTDLKDKLKQLQQERNKDGLGKTEKMLKGLRGTKDAYDNELNRDLAKGDFAKAAKRIKDILGKLNSGKMTDAEKKALENQLKDLSDQVGRLADAEKQIGDMLKRQGMDSGEADKMAGMSEEDLREALKDKGWSDEQIEDLMDKISEARNACKKCDNLSDKLADCQLPGQLPGGLNPDGMIALSETLGEMAGEQVGEMSLKDAMKALEGAIARLGEGECGGGMMLVDDGEGGMVIAGGKPGQGAIPGGMPGPGAGRGHVDADGPEEELGKVNLKGTGVPNRPNKDAEIIGSWLVRGATVTGESKKKLTEAVQAGKDAAAEAVRDNKIPRKLENVVKEYFGGMESVAGGDANQP